MNRRSALGLAGCAALGSVVPAGAQSATPDARSRNVEIAERYIIAVWIKKTPGAVEAFVSDSYQSGDPTDAPGIAAFKARVHDKISSDSDLVQQLSYTIDAALPSGDDVIVRGHVVGVSSSGKEISALYFDQLRFKDGLIVTSWRLEDRTAMYGF